ncbi:MAG TPA: G8 domain-containing protein, partial [Bacteroidota bacterium]|nr:G8 domain-containing protein [Bacteroidota bacterium]
MKRLLLLLVLAAALVLGLTCRAYSDDIVSAGSQGSPVKGSWSLPATWAGGTVPGPLDNVTIFDGDTVMVDVSATVASITVGSGTGGALIFNSTASVNLTVSGDFIVSANAAFRCTGGSTSPVIDTLFMYGNFQNSGSTLDMRTGSGPNYGVCYIVFVGNTNSSFRSTSVYNSNTNEFNGITIMKSGNANVILGSDITMAGGSSSYPNTQPYLDLRHGMIVTGNYSIINRSTAANTPNPVIVGGSDSSYVLGSFGRGMSSTSVTTRTFPVGDSHGYHPIQVHNASGGGATGHNLRVKLIFGNANPSASALSGGIDKVSTARYYKLTYDRGVGADTTTTSASMSFDRFMPGYTQQDGVAAGSTNLRVGYTTD